MREQLDTLRTLMRSSRLDVQAVSMALDEMPAITGAEIPVVVDQARRAIVAVRAGKVRYRPLLRHAIARLVVLLEKQVVVATG